MKSRLIQMAVLILLVVTMISIVSNAQQVVVEDPPMIQFEQTAVQAKEVSAEVTLPSPTVITVHQEEVQTQAYTSIIMSRDWDVDDGYMLAKIAMAEAEGEGVKGKALVICVVLNRVWTQGSFGNTIRDVIYEPYQFSPVASGRYDQSEPDEECWEALSMVENGWDESFGALYFESDDNPNNWHSRNLEHLFTYKNHKFYK